MIARASLLAVALGLLAPTSAQAGDTYCVGGFGVCGSPAIAGQHGAWHQHCFVFDGKQCFECYDEQDNTCATVFLRDHPGWRTISRGECLVRSAIAGRTEGLRYHKIRGREVAPPPPPPPRRVTVKPEVVRISGGPYASGDEVQFDLRVIDDTGQLRDFQTGEVVLFDRSGAEVARSAVELLGGGLGRAVVKLPAGGDLRARFVPQGVQLDASEQMGGTEPEDLSIEVGHCNFRAIVSAAAGDVHLAGAHISVTGSLVTHKGDAVHAAAVASVPIELVVELDDGTAARAPVQIDGAQLAGSVQLPKIASDQIAARVTMSGAAGGVAVCPGKPLAISVTRLGIAVGAGAPSVCYATRPCKATFSFRTPNGPAKAQAAAFLSRGDLVLRATANSAPLEPIGAPASGSVELAHTPSEAGQLTYRVTLSGDGQELTKEVAVEVRDAVEVDLAEELDLGTISGATGWRDTCVDLDFSKSRGAIGAVFAFAIDGEDEDCQAQHVTHDDGVRYPLGEPLERMVGADRRVPICVVVPRCPKAEKADGIALQVRSTIPEFAQQRARVRLRYRIERRSAFSCWQDLTIVAAGALLAGFVVHGFLWPKSFDDGDQIRIARDRRKLKKARGVLLAEQRHGRKRWHRSARVGFTSSGEATANRRAALFVLSPIPSGVGMATDARVLKENRRTKKMEVEAGAGGRYQLSRNVIYQVSDVVFLLS